MRDLIVIITVFVCTATLATVMSIPAVDWATGGPEWKIAIALVWVVACYGLCAYAAMRFFKHYRH